jgi:uncharacterized protein YnzC (UPF0291/DUF896 family)
MIEEEKNSAKEELKRADHLIYVSLKYTRTVDVIRSVVDRFMSAQEMTIDSLLGWLKKKKKLKEVDLSKPYRIKIEWVRSKLKKDKKIEELLELYEYFVKTMKAEYVKKEEFRKNVRMTIHDSKGNILDEVGVDVLKEKFKEVCDLIENVEKMIK